jgi:Ribonuclease G/E
MAMTYCKECPSKQQKTNNLEEEVVCLKKLRYQERRAKEGFFSSSTPSSKIPVKPNRQKYQRNRGDNNRLFY